MRANKPWQPLVCLHARYIAHLVIYEYETCEIH
jgi:hypothetical protein